MKRLIALLLCISSPVFAQAITKSAPATASIVLTTTLSLTNTAGIDFGTFPAAPQTVAAPAPATWTGSTEPGGMVNISFGSLPTVLTQSGGTSTMGLSFGTTSASYLPTGGAAIAFDPSVGRNSLTTGSGGGFSISLGTSAVVGNTGAVQAAIGANPPGTYNATVTLTVVH